VYFVSTNASNASVYSALKKASILVSVAASVHASAETESAVTIKSQLGQNDVIVIIQFFIKSQVGVHRRESR
jgi:hypothetical protein